MSPACFSLLRNPCVLAKWFPCARLIASYHTKSRTIITLESELVVKVCCFTIYKRGLYLRLLSPIIFTQRADVLLVAFSLQGI